ncbi:MAG: DUF2029 domain-containing protein, partial [Bdellovibrionaceae bacterium]|nr:DUF2029 domain-containing protein [Pseudobdellovibrionaceae bacterium]
VWGLDFQNLWSFHNCAAPGATYDVGRGAICQDLGARDMYYPPTLYKSFAWTAGLTFDQARLSMALVLVVALTLSFGYVALSQFLPGQPLSGRVAAVFVFLLGVQFPTLFALERLNNDFVIVVLSVVSVALMSRGYLWIAGLAFGLSVSFKLYPGLAAVIAATVALIVHRGTFTSILRFAFGATIAVLLTMVLDWADWKTYVTQVLPVFSDRRSGLNPISHSLRSTPVGPLIVASLITLGLFVRQKKRWAVEMGSITKPQLAQLFASTLLISIGAVTLSNGVSFDYNLILSTLTVLLLLRLPLGWISGTAFLCLMFGVYGPKALHHMPLLRESLLLLGFFLSYLAVLSPSSLRIWRSGGAA